MEIQKNNQKEEALSKIGFKSFIIVIAMLSTILILAGAMTYFIPQGSFSYNESGEIIPNTFVAGEMNGIAIWRVLTAPFRVFFGSDGLTVLMISLFLLIMAGVFNVMEKTKGLKVMIKKCVAKFSNKKRLVVMMAILIFMLFGSFFGLLEELVTLLPIILILMLSLGYDSLTGLGVCMLSACFGFAAAITNPFSIGLAAQMAGIHVFNGVWLRLIFFVFIFAILCLFIFAHIKRIQKNPKSSITYEADLAKLEKLNINSEEVIENEEKIFKAYSVFFVIAVLGLVLIASIRAISGFAIPILAVVFLFGGLSAGLVVTKEKSKIFKWFIQGIIGMIPAVFMIMLASSVKLILDEGGVKDTVMNWVIGILSGKSKFFTLFLFYLLILFLQLFIGSASAKIMLVMPIILPVCSALGLSPAIVILTYCMGDGFSNMIMPTNPVLLIGLSIGGVSYGKWFKWTWKLQVFVFLFTLLFILFAVSIGY